jgi:hypothetical protein
LLKLFSLHTMQILVGIVDNNAVFIKFNALPRKFLKCFSSMAIFKGFLIRLGNVRL